MRHTHSSHILPHTYRNFKFMYGERCPHGFGAPTLFLLRCALNHGSVPCGSAIILTDACFYQHSCTSLFHFTFSIFSFHVDALSSLLVSPSSLPSQTTTFFSSSLLKPQNVFHILIFSPTFSPLSSTSHLISASV